MTRAEDLRAQVQHAQEMAERVLAWAVGIVQNQGDVVFKKQVRVEKGAFLITVRLPGVIRVSDAMSGDVLAESAPGNLLTLADGFKAPFGAR